MDRDSALFDAAVGALVTVVLSVIPFSPLAGGAAAAVRRENGYGRGLALGAASGALAAVPLGLLFVPALWIAGLLGFGLPPSSPAYDVFLAIVAALFLAYTVGLSAVGGVAGVWLDRRTERDLDATAWL